MFPPFAQNHAKLFTILFHLSAAHRVIWLYVSHMKNKFDELLNWCCFCNWIFSVLNKICATIAHQFLAFRTITINFVKYLPYTSLAHTPSCLSFITMVFKVNVFNAQLHSEQWQYLLDIEDFKRKDEKLFYAL